MTRDEVLDTAKALINGDRARDYGDAFDNHTRIAAGWDIIVRHAMENPGHVTPMHVALMMDWLKTCRLLNTLDHADSWTDKAAYSALGGEFAGRDTP